jgi:hypothetical protein
MTHQILDRGDPPACICRLIATPTFPIEHDGPPSFCRGYVTSLDVKAIIGKLTAAVPALNARLELVSSEIEGTGRTVLVWNCPAELIAWLCALSAEPTASLLANWNARARFLSRDVPAAMLCDVLTQMQELARLATNRESQLLIQVRHFPAN